MDSCWFSVRHELITEWLMLLNEPILKSLMFGHGATAQDFPKAITSLRHSERKDTKPKRKSGMAMERLLNPHGNPSLWLGKKAVLQLHPCINFSTFPKPLRVNEASAFLKA